MKINATKKIDGAFSMTSIADIIFLLLIFMLIKNRYCPQAVPVDLPSSIQKRTLSAPVNLTVTAKLRYYVEGISVPFDRLEAELQTKLSRTSHRAVLLHMDKQLAISHMVQLADIIHRLDASVSIATEFEKKDAF